MARIVFFLIGCLLAFTATAKLWMLITDPFADLSLYLPSSVAYFVVVTELAAASLILKKNVSLEQKYAITFSLFAILSAGSIYGIFAGYNSCGCFGKLSVSPWVSLAISMSILFFNELIRTITSTVRSSISNCNHPSILPFGTMHKGFHELLQRFGGLFLAWCVCTSLFFVVNCSYVKQLLQWSFGERAVTALVKPPEFSDSSVVVDVLLSNHTDFPVSILGIEKSCYCVSTDTAPVMIPRHGGVGLKVRIDRKSEEAYRDAQRLVFYLDAPRQRVLSLNLVHDWRKK